MKVEPKAQLSVAPRAQPFKQLLAEARSEMSRRPPPLPVLRQATVSSRSSTAQTLERARTHAHGEAQRLGVVRTEAHAGARVSHEVRQERSEAVQERTEARVLEFIAREFSPDPSPRLPQFEASIHQLRPLTPKPEAPEEAKAAQAVALIERIELFVRSQRPGLALTLNNSLGAHVEIERIGPREIALKWVGHRGPPTAEAVSRIREELRARGLKVGALSVA